MLFRSCSAGMAWAHTAINDSPDGAGPRTWTVNVVTSRTGVVLSEVHVAESKLIVEMSACRFPDWGVAVSSKLTLIKDGTLTFEVLCAPGKPRGLPARQ